MPDGSKSPANFLRKVEALFRYQKGRHTRGTVAEGLMFRQETAKEVVNASASIALENWMSQMFDDDGCG